MLLLPLRQPLKKCILNEVNNNASRTTQVSFILNRLNGNTLKSINRQTFSTKNSKPSGARRANVSKEERASLRAKRRAQVEETAQKSQRNASSSEASTAQSTSSTSTSANVAAAVRSDQSSFRLKMYGGLGISTALLGWGIYDPEDSAPAKFLELIGLRSVLFSWYESFALPANDKLLPNWVDMPYVPHDLPPPITLVLDLENTLVSSEWDRKYGWRHAKRPGVDKFLRRMAEYYEIVVFTPSPQGLPDLVMANLNESCGGGILHFLFRNHTYYLNGVHCKDLSKLNRNPRRVIVLDDDPAALQLQPENLIQVKPYTDPHDREDQTLEKITPFLIELAKENCTDVPGVLRQFKGMDADEIGDEYQRRISRLREMRLSGPQGGLGRLGGRGRSSLPEPELQSFDYDVLNKNNNTAQKGQLTAKDLVGSAPAESKGSKEGGVIGWWKMRQQEKEEEQMRQMEKMNEFFQKKHAEQQRLQEEKQRGMSA